MEKRFCPTCGAQIKEEFENNGVYFCHKCENEFSFDELDEEEKEKEDGDDEEDSEYEIPDGCEVVYWPDSQYLMDAEDFEDLELLPEDHFGPCAFLVESDWLKENYPNLAN